MTTVEPGTTPDTTEPPSAPAEFDPDADSGPEPRERDFRVVGQSPAHHDFVNKVRGTLLYAADWNLPGMIHGKVVRSDVAPARIVRIDTSAAERLEGVVAVLTAADVPHNAIVEHASGGLGELTVEQPVLARDRVRYVGEPVAVVAATDPETAAEAVDLVEVEYEPLPGVYRPEDALADGAPLVHDEGNVLVNWHLDRGDVDAAFAAADVVVDHTYRSQHVEHAYLETEAGVGWIENDVVTLRISTQVIEHAVEIATILGLPQSQVRVIASYMGGGFGGKEDMTVEPYIALLVWRTRRPVRMIWSRQESILASTKRHPFTMHYRTAATKDGKILAVDADIVGDAGAYPCLSARVLFAGAALSPGPYKVPAVRIRSRAVFTNNVPTSAFRGFGAMQVTLGYESQMDALAAELGLSREEVRDRNYIEKGDLLAGGEPITTAVAVRETRDAALEMLGEPSQPSGPNRVVGRGFACGMQPYGRSIWFRDHAAAWVTLQADGTLLIRSGVTDLGAGQAASLCQIASEILGVALSDISVYIGDTALTPPAGGTYATRQLYMSGNAILRAARKLRDQLTPVAAKELGVPEDALVWVDGMVRTEDGTTGLSLPELVRAANEARVDTAVLNTWRARSGGFDPQKGQGHTYPDYTFGTHAAEVEVDLETGDVRLLKYAACHDVGRAINPTRVHGQIIGGAAQGIGYALTEDCVTDAGHPLSSLFADYLIPTAMDLPDIRVAIVESGEGRGPLNARGIGEPPIGPPAATIASAVEAAIGVRPTQLPITAERVLALLDQRELERGDSA
ncbi:aldehyde oxidase [Mycolicibacterium mageritense DSM 44476 = CIP 104973]|uniref:Dehydrogenase n=1 Tax=Mycolicibacterium mageritense TaxID=53462 RepID=A0ABN5YM47_MYCME|nr:xanthine dehydrogenase family protein molybdopterin-binding subunit [Mycolicibacterium mageritense]MBN3453914.1 xanthine dehydrogenase family protein molybdopterin-binding subunit [Mycobacterium sp. DSM 3803]MCC9182676.1 xanthine dehydrogenase family protein molybdopterin-binding subunit [Mycolicibacterium mageritense]BBX38352.1 dehydrogenase [Mycolicibacterium mageritense]CDO26915.1 aerobic-type carbon monoxide dehydrogenase, large subunit CoxL/CutL-like protein [Mycolicibacterium mageriten